MRVRAMMTRREVGTGVVALAMAGAGRAFGDKFPKLAPYTCMRWAGEVPEVEVEAHFYRLRAIDGVTSEQLVAFAKKTYDELWKKRVSEDLVQVMTELGHAPGEKVTLQLEELDSRAPVVRKDVPMTHENRQKVWQANQKAGI
jgi:hypothetical protein